MSKKAENSIEVSNVVNTTPHNEAIYEAGKTLLVESITTGREFCKFMITMSTSAIPIYLGLLKFVLPEKYILSLSQGIFAVIPAFVFLIAAIIFTIGYYPQIGKFSLDIVEEIEAEREKTIKNRRLLTWIGFTFFIVALIAMILCVLIFLTDILK
ncbi:MAG: hypothetical protein JXB49_29490 [Bacteroidales bacterium]|nr:hypothetical protein [Bacteroidales bacterium]